MEKKPQKHQILLSVFYADIQMCFLEVMSKLISFPLRSW